MSNYYPTGVRSPLMRIPMADDAATPGAATFSASSDCALIPAGDPYRVPGNKCQNGGSTYTFDASGNVVKTSDGTIFGYPSTLVIGVGAAVALVALLANRKKR